MRSIAIINQKGGVGKTTSTTNLAAAFAARGKRVLAIDLDPQAHLTINLGLDVTGSNAGIYAVLTDSASIIDAAVQARENLWLVPSHIDLAAAESELVSIVGREVILRDALAAASDRFDILLIDCPPSLGVLTINALAAVTEVFIPLQPHFLALQGLGKLLDQTIRLVAKRINPQLKVTGIMLTMYEGGTRLAGEVVDDVKSFFAASRNTDCPWSDARVFETVIRRNIKLAESPSHGATIFDYAPKSNGAVDYAKLAAEILGDLRAADPPGVRTVTASTIVSADTEIDAPRATERAPEDESKSLTEQAPAGPDPAGAPRSALPALIGRPYGEFGQGQVVSSDRATEQPVAAPPDTDVDQSDNTDSSTELSGRIEPAFERDADTESSTPANHEFAGSDQACSPPHSDAPALIGRPYGDFCQDKDASTDRTSPATSALCVRSVDRDREDGPTDSVDSADVERTPGPPPLAHGDRSEDVANIA